MSLLSALAMVSALYGCPPNDEPVNPKIPDGPPTPPIIIPDNPIIDEEEDDEEPADNPCSTDIDATDLTFSIYGSTTTLSPIDDATFSVEVSGMKSDFEANCVDLKSNGLTFAVKGGNFQKGEKIFDVTVKYDSATEFSNGTASVSVGLKNTNPLRCTKNHLC